MIDHDHDEHGNCIPPTDYGQPNWRFSLWDIFAILISFVGSIAGSLGSIGINFHQTTNLIARECGAAANFQRQTKELEEANRLNEAARAKMAAGLRELVEGDGS